MSNRNQDTNVFKNNVSSMFHFSKPHFQTSNSVYRADPDLIWIYTTYSCHVGPDIEVNLTRSNLKVNFVDTIISQSILQSKFITRPCNENLNAWPYQATGKLLNLLMSFMLATAKKDSLRGNFNNGPQ